MTPRKVVENELTREIILDTARILFADTGYQHVSMRKIATELGYSHGALYYHFRNKAEIFYAIILKDFALLDTELQSVFKMKGTSLEKGRQVLLSFIKFGMDHPNHYELMFLTKDKEVKSYLKQEPNKSYERFAKTIHQLTEKKAGPKEIWFVLLSVHGFVTVHSRNDQTFDEVKGLAETHVNLILKAVLT